MKIKPPHRLGEGGIFNNNFNSRSVLPCDRRQGAFTYAGKKASSIDLSLPFKLAVLTTLHSKNYGRYSLSIPLKFAVLAAVLSATTDLKEYGVRKNRPNAS